MDTTISAGNWWIRAKVQAAGLLASPPIGFLVGRLFAERVPFRGCVIDTSAPQIPSRTKAMLFWQMYESAEARFVQRHLRSDLDVIELGSGIGAVTALIAKKLSGRKLIAVEAHPELANVIQCNARLNGPLCNTVVVSAGISYGSKSFTHFRNQPGLLGSHVTTDPECSQLVCVRTLSDIRSERAIGRYALVADIEGAEAGVLLGDQEALRECEQIIIELHESVYGERVVGPEMLLHTLTDTLGFELVDRRGNACVLVRPRGH